MTIFTKQNLAITVMASIIPIGIFGGIEIKKHYELLQKEKLSEEFQENKLKSFSKKEAELHQKKLLDEQRQLKTELMSINEKRKKAMSIEERKQA
ncbi:hypothetical protein BB561_005736 [Smittium simulii]|uniref:Uncharacterized protein n=1 Tax=Smittium simulii TaxID=133385 RepID=A0A2T9Y8P3_9FUNG|nr:hypothetical protein BB561_005736 [Smittium simulii]